MTDAISSRETCRVCTLCEATCGIEVQVEKGRVASIRGDKEDPFSRGYICPKAYGLKGIEEDPDRLREPVKRTPHGWERIPWDEAYRLAIDGLSDVRKEHGPDSVGSYVGNPTAHSYQAMFYVPALLKALGSKQRYSASSADQLPKMISAGLMFGAGLTVPVPDLDRTSYLLVLGANPAVSNGSLMTAPRVGERISAIRARGGKVVVVDPRLTETARLATEHVFIRPGTDAALLLSMLNVLFADNRVELGRVKELVTRLDVLRARVEDFTPEAVSRFCGIAPETIRRLSREFSDAPRAACYGRIGTTCQSFGTIASFAVDALNVVTGNLDEPGGAMFSEPAANRGNNPSSAARPGRGIRLPSAPSRVRGLPDWFGEYPVATLADEILMPGEGRLRAMVTIAGNPVSSVPNTERMEAAFSSLEFMVSVDFYVNETTRFANVILPPPSPLERDHYDLALYQLAIRNVAKYSPRAIPLPPGRPDEWEILLTLAKGLGGTEAVSLDQADDFAFTQLATSEIGQDGGRWPGLTVEEAASALSHEKGPRRLLELLLRTGPYGEGFGRKPDGLTLRTLEEHRHGVDLGPLKPRIPGVLRTRDGNIDLAPERVIDDFPRLAREMAVEARPLSLIGRRHLRSNNSWMHNVHALVKGKPRCTLLVSGVDAARASLTSGDRARLSSASGSVVAVVEVSDEMMPGVVSLPHGWGHDESGVLLSVARREPGVNVNVVSDEHAVDAVSGNAAFNGLPVTLERCEPI
jgi:anaerobic selenocysteine-containing dehydrogenase